MGRLRELLEPVYAHGSFDTGVPALLGVADPDFEFQTSGFWFDLADKPAYRGHEEVAGFFRKLADAFETLSFDVERLVERDDAVVVVVNMRATGQHSGIETERRVAHLWRFRGDRAVLFRAYNDPDEALAALNSG
jgi:ketosteroid isomerase-like protein